MYMPGAGDPNFYEWYVGLENVIKMLNPDSGIKHVIFQHDEYNTIDDVVVEYYNGNTQVCYQVKHNIGTAAPVSLTFGSILEKTGEKSSLFEAMLQGWKKASAASSATIIPVLFTNRRMLNRRARHYLNGKPYSAYGVNDFILKMQKTILSQKDCSDFTFSDDALRCQWEELRNTLSSVETEDLVDFIKCFRIEANQPSLSNMKQSLVDLIARTFGCNDGVALTLFANLLVGLTDWTTTERKNREVRVEDVYSVLSIEPDLDDSQHRLIPPYPFFESRKSFCETLVNQIRATRNKIVFISGNPGSGKTSIISFIQSEYNLFSLRYHTFRPISPEQRFYNTDPGMCTQENLWGTLLSQLRNRLRGSLAEYEVPVSNKLISIDKLRGEVIRLLRILAQNAISTGEKIYICIDGIDHAARANTDVSFLDSLPTPEELPEGVCFIIVGQPTTMYEEQYPTWLSTHTNIDHIDIPLLDMRDIEQLIISRAKQFEDSAADLAKLIYKKTEGNNLSAVFAVEEIRPLHTLEEAVAYYQRSGICGNIQQYYEKIWGYMKNELSSIIHCIIYPESIVACPLLLMNGRVNTHILSQALQYEINQKDWTMIFDRLFPLIVRTEVEGEYALFHNDFRVFLMGVIKSYKERYKEIALALAKYLLQNNEGLLSYTMGITLLQDANCQKYIPKYFTPEFVINALAEGVSKLRLDEFAHLSFRAACDNTDYTGYRNTYLSIKTLHQHFRYYEYHQKSYISTDYPEISAIDISEIKSFPVSSENIEIFNDVLIRCSKLFSVQKGEYIDRALALYHKWFDRLSPLSFVPLLSEDISGENIGRIETSKVGLFLQHWGTVAAELNIPLIKINNNMSFPGLYSVFSFGNPYFKYCIEYKKYSLAKNAIKLGYAAQQAFSEKIEDIYYAEASQEFDDILSQVKQNKEKSLINLLAQAMKISIDSSYVPDRSTLESSPQVNRIYDENCFTLVLKSFLLGRIESTIGDDELIKLSDEYCSEIEGNSTEICRACYLARVSALLGKYYWNNTFSSDRFEGYSEWLLTADLRPSFDYSRARRFLLFSLFHSKAVSFFEKSENFINALRRSLFEIDSLGMHYKTIILDFVVKQNRLDIVKEYIDTLYGKNCSHISKDELKADTHGHFQKYGELVNPVLMSQFSEKLKWDVVGYIGADEYAMYAPLECFDVLIKLDPSKWNEFGTRLYKQSQIADLSSNRASYEIKNSITKAAVQCGIADYWELRKWHDEFRLDPDQIYHALFDFINNAKNIETLQAVWILCCGIQSWYTQKERQGAKCIYDACLKKAIKLNLEFTSFVSQRTPHWMSIITHMDTSTNFDEDLNGYITKRSTKLASIQASYDTLSIDESIDVLVTIEHERSAQNHYRIVLNKILASVTNVKENLSKLLDSYCIYLQGRSWSNEEDGFIISALLSELGNEAFWKLAESIYDQLSEYEYQTSMRNMQFLLKLNCRSNLQDMESLFDEEIKTQKLWATGNGHFDVDHEEGHAEIAFTAVPLSIYEMVLYILLEQMDSQNTRKIESAIYAIYLLGLQFPQSMEIITQKWPSLSQNQEEFLLAIFAKWATDGACAEPIRRFIRDMYDNCAELTKKYYLHSILLKLRDSGINEQAITFDAPFNGYELPCDGGEKTESYYQEFLLTIERYIDDQDIDNIRKYIFKISPLETYVNDPYAKAEDSLLPTVNVLPGKIFYDKEKKGDWNSVPIAIKKAKLLPIEDPFILTEMPRITFDEEWFPIIPGAHDGKKHEYLSHAKLQKITNYDIGANEIVLASSLWYPWGHNDGTIYIQSSKIGVRHDAQWDQTLNRCAGNFGLLANEWATIDEIYFTNIANGGLSLFDYVYGNLKLILGNCQLAPSSIWHNCFGCTPTEKNPYVWLNSEGKQILHFERIASPVREIIQEPYIRQPILFRWVCDKEWINEIVASRGLLLFPFSIQIGYPHLTE